MNGEERNSGIDIIGNVPWGTHFCQFYQTSEDLIDILVPFFKAGLENNEFCMWVTSEPLRVEEAKAALGKVAKNLDDCIKKGQIEILPHTQWYLKDGVFDLNRVLAAWVDKLERALRQGYEGLRITGNTAWLEQKDWQSFTDYEAEINRVIGNHRMIAVCTYSLGMCGAPEIIDVVSNHRFALIRRQGEWHVIESTEQVRVEKVLKESEERYRTLFKRTSNPILVIDTEGNYIDSNEAALQFLKCTREELLTKNVRDTAPPEADAAEKMRKHLPLWESGGRIETEYYVSGKVKTLDLTITPGLWQGRRVVFGIGTDITERRQAEEALQRAEENFRRSVDDSPLGIRVVSADGELLYANRAILDIYGYDSLEELEATPRKKRYTPESYAEHQTRKEKRQRGESVPSNYEISIVRKDGEIRHLEVFRKEVLWNGKAQFQVLYHDITERKQAEEALYESEERYRALMELGGRVGEAIIMRQDTEQGEGTHVFVSDEWCRITGYSKKELLSMSFFDLVHPGYREESLARYRRRMRGENLPGLFELSIVRKDSTEVPIELTSASTTYKGKPAVVAFIRDITERRKLQEQLMVTDRLASVGELAAGIAHEINNPLTSVIGFSDLLLQKDVPSDVREDLQVVNREAKRTAEIIKNLLTFARRHETAKRPVNINDIIKNVLELRAYEQKVHNIEVKTNLATDLPEITADPFRLQQVFINIVINAEHFTSVAHGRGTLTITTERVGDLIRASFADDGPGIAEENLSRIFDPFFTTKETGKGTGLGLSICHGVVTEHGGRIYAESELGKGATFIIELPVTQ